MAFIDDKEKALSLPDLASVFKSGSNVTDHMGPPDLSNVSPTPEQWEKFKSMPTGPREDVPLEDELGRSVARGAIGLAKVVPEMAEFVGSDVMGSDAVKKVTRPIITGMEDYAQERFGQSPSLDKKDMDVTDIRWWASKLPESAVSMAGFFLGGEAAGGMAMLARYGKLIKAAEAVGNVEKAEALAAQVAKIARAGAYGTGMAMEAAGARESQRQWEAEHPGQQLSWGQKVGTTLGTGIISGGLEAASLEHIFGKKFAGSLIGKVLDSIAWEGGTEGAQQIIANAFEKFGYNPSKELSDGVLESIVVGAALGGLGGSVERATHGVQKAIDRANYSHEVDTAQRADLGASEFSANEAAARRSAFMPGMAPAATIEAPMGSTGDETTGAAGPAPEGPAPDNGPAPTSEGLPPDAVIGPEGDQPMGVPGGETTPDLSQSPYYKGEGPDPVPPASPVPPTSQVTPISSDADFQIIFGQGMNDAGLSRLLNHAGVNENFRDALVTLVREELNNGMGDEVNKRAELNDMLTKIGGLDPVYADALTDGLLKWSEGPFNFGSWTKEQYGGQGPEVAGSIATTPVAPEGPAAAEPVVSSDIATKIDELYPGFASAEEKAVKKGRDIPSEPGVSPGGETIMPGVKRVPPEPRTSGTEPATEGAPSAIADKSTSYTPQHGDKVAFLDIDGNRQEGVVEPRPPGIPPQNGESFVRVGDRTYLIANDNLEPGVSPEVNVSPGGENIMPGVKRPPLAPRKNIEAQTPSAGEGVAPSPEEAATTQKVESTGTRTSPTPTTAPLVKQKAQEAKQGVQPAGMTGKKPSEQTGTRTGPTPAADQLAKEKDREAKKKIEEYKKVVDNKKESVYFDKEAKGKEAPNGDDNVNAKTTGDDRGGTKESSSEDLSTAKKNRESDEVSPGSGRGDAGSSGRGSGRGSGKSVKGTKSGKEGKGPDDGVEPGGSGYTGDVPGVQRSADYRIATGELNRQGGWLTTAKRNLDIIELVKKLDAEGRQATSKEQALLVQFTGWGASEIRNGLFGSHRNGTLSPNSWTVKKEWKPLVERAIELMTPEEIKAAAQSTQYAHYTSETVIQSIYNVLERFGFKGGLVLEPGMGNGLFAGLMPDEMHKASKYTGIEMDHMTAAIAKYLFPNHTVIQGDYTKEKFPDNFYDVAVGNPPFAQTKVLADPAYRKYSFSLHDYFFAKTIDKVRPGGIMVFVTSRYTMDKQRDRARKYLSERADLVGAIRLPNTAFQENAGTEVVTDIIILRKRAENEIPGGEAWRGIEAVNAQGQEVFVNEYFANHPEMILGRHSTAGTMYASNEYTVLPNEGQSLGHELAKVVENLPENIYTITQKDPESQKEIVKDFDLNPTNKKEGGLYLDTGKLYVNENGVGLPPEDVFGKKLTDKQKVWLRDYIGLRNALKTAQHDQLTDGHWEASLKELNKVYDAFVKKHGYLLSFTQHERTKINDEGEEISVPYRIFKYSGLLKYDTESPLVYALESITDDGKIVKGVSLLGRTIQKPVRIEPKTAPEALAIALDEKGHLDLDYIAGRLNIAKDEVIAQLGDLIYEDPTRTWETADAYLSGDVVSKLEEAQKAAQTDEKYQRNVQALEKVQPKPLSHQDINVVLGAPWVPLEIVNIFVGEVIDNKLSVAYEPRINLWKIHEGNSSYRKRGNAWGYNADLSSEWGTSDKKPYEILDAVLNNKTIKITRSEKIGGTVKTWTDVAATAQANQKAQEMRDRFRTWVWTDAQRAGELLELYNRTYNNLAPRRFDGAHLTLPGLNTRYDLHPHQKRAIWRIVQSGNTYLAHAVGSGKTLEMVCAGMEMRRLGLISKPIYVVPNHMLEQFACEFLEAYPMAKIMVASEKNFHTDNRRRFMAQAAINKPDAIIITHSSLQKIGMSAEAVNEVSNRFLDDLYDTLDELKDDKKGNRIQIRKLEQRIEQFQQRIASLITDKDNTLSFEEMGVDFMFVDEAHEFRKLDFVTNRQAKGIDAVGSKKAFDLYIKTYWLNQQRPGRSHVFASGTPVTNTLAELYTLQRFFDGVGMERDGIHHFDAWANMFGQVFPDFEMNAAGQYENVERFSRFVNMPELMKRVRTFMDVLTFRQLNESLQNLGKKAGKGGIPDIQGGQAQLVVIPKSEILDHYQSVVLKQRMDDSKSWKPSKYEKGNPDPIINIITDGRLASIDMRFVTSSAPETDGKLYRMGESIAEVYHRTKDAEYIGENGKPDSNKGACQIVFYNHGFGPMVISRRGFDSRKWLTQLLKSKGVNPDHIAWIDDYKTAIAKNSLFKEMRSGHKRILIGSAIKMGTGVNVQKRLYAMHYLDPPWYPANLEQPEGRILRQGNQNDEVAIYRYAVKGSYDTTMWQMVARKAKFIEQAFLGEDSMRTMDDISQASQYQQVAALTSGDERMIQVAGLEADVERLRQLRIAHDDEQQALRSQRSGLNNRNKYSADRVKAYGRVTKKLDGYVREIKGEIDGTTYDKRDEFGKALIDKISAMVKKHDAKSDKQTKTIGSINDFDLKVTTKTRIGVPVASLDVVLDKDVVHEIEVDFESHDEGVERGVKAFLENTSPSGLTTKVVNQLNAAHENLRYHERSLEENNEKLTKIEKRIGAPFQYEQDLLEKIAELETLKAELLAESQQQPGQQQGEVEETETEGDEINLDDEDQVSSVYRTGPMPQADLLARQKAREAVQGAPQMRLGKAAGATHITTQDVVKVFGKGSEVIDANETGVHIRTAGGRDIVVFTDATWELTAEQIAEIERAYGRQWSSDDVPLGSFEVIDGAGVIKLAKVEGAKTTLRHESFHAATRFVLTEKEQRAILREFGTWEEAAEAYETWKPAEKPHTLFQKILDFFKRLVERFSPTAESVFYKVYSGQVWSRADNQVGQLTDANDIAVGIGAKRKVQAKLTDREVVDNFVTTHMAPEPVESKTVGEKFRTSKDWLGQQFEKFYFQVVAGQAPIERKGEKAAANPLPGVVMPAGQRPDLAIAQYRGRTTWAEQALEGEGVYHDEVDNFTTKDVLELSAKAQQEFIDKGHVSPYTAEKLEKAQSKTYFTGGIKKVGESLKSILQHDDLVKAAEGLGIGLDQVHKDIFKVKMPAERTMELGGWFGNRLPGDIKNVDPIEAKETLEALQRIYGTHYTALEDATAKIRDWMDKTLLQPLVTVGQISQEVYNQIKERNLFYIPFFRLMDEMSTNGFVSNNTNLFEVRNIPVKTIKGSERQIIDPLEMIIHLAYNVHDVYTRSKVARTLYDLSQFSAEGDDITVTKARYFQVPTTLKKEIDPVLYTQLEDFLNSLGTTLRIKTKMRIQREFGKVTQEVRQEWRDGYIHEEEAQFIDLLFGATEKSLTHLAGHVLYEKYSELESIFHLDEKVQPGQEHVIRKELRAIADQRLMGAESQGFKRFVRVKREQVAEFINRYVNANDTARAMAPNAVKAFEEFLRNNPELNDLLTMRPSHKIGIMEFEDKAWVKSQFAPKPNTMIIKSDGVPYWVEMPPDIYAAATGMTQGEVSILQKILAWPANLLRAGAILNPEFMARNFPRDVIQAMILSRTGFTAKDWIGTAVGRLFGNNQQIKDWWAEWEAGGGPFATFAHSMTDHVKLKAEQLAGEKHGKARIIFRNGPIEALRDLSGFVENITRFAIYKQARENGLSHAEAIHASRTTTLDFSRIGAHPFIRALNMIIPFFNPAVQGLDKVAKELRGPNRNTVLLRLGMMMAGSVMLWFMFHDDDRIKELEPWEKNYFWHIPMGSDGPIVRIPKPFELGLAFASTPERLLDWMVDGDRGGVQAVAKAMGEAVLPPLLPTAMRPFVELGANWNFFLGRPIEDVSLTSLPPELRAKPWTKELSKAVGALTGKVTGGNGISPIQFEHFVMTLGGGLAANYLLPGVDLVLRKAGVLNDIPQPTQDTLQQLWGVRSYFTKPPTGYKARTVNDFFERYQEITQADAGWKALWNTGQNSKLDAFLEDNPEAMMGRIARKQISLMGNVKKERNQIYNDPNMDADTKRVRLDELDRKIYGIARMARDFFDNRVLNNLEMPKRDGLSKEQYYKRISEATTDAWDAYRRQYDEISNMSPGDRSAAISQILRKSYAEYREIPKNPVTDLLKPFRADTIFDKATRQERLAAHDVFGAKLPRGVLPAFTGFRQKQEVD